MVLTGGTIDITIHQICPEDGLAEVHAATGGGWGGILVDKAFRDLLIEMVGPEIYEEFVKTETEDWIYLWRVFENKKKTITPENNDKIRMRLPASLSSLYKDKTGHDLTKGINRSKYANEIELDRDKILISHKIMKGLFENSAQTTIAHLKSVLQESEEDKIKAILMVGGFSESPVLQDAIRAEFRHLQVIIPPAPSSVILRGSVIFGHDPLTIKQRVLKKTYGCGETYLFNERIHPKDKKQSAEFIGKTYDVVRTFGITASKGETVFLGQTQPEKTYLPLFPSQKTVGAKFYASDDRKPEYIDDSCTLIGQMKIDVSGLPDDENEKKVMISLNFSNTEIRATACVKKTGKTTDVKLDFLG